MAKSHLSFGFCHQNQQFGPARVQGGLEEKVPSPGRRKTQTLLIFTGVAWHKISFETRGLPRPINLLLSQAWKHAAGYGHFQLLCRDGNTLPKVPRSWPAARHRGLHRTGIAFKEHPPSRQALGNLLMKVKCFQSDFVH